MKHLLAGATALLAVACAATESAQPTTLNVSSAPELAELTQTAIATWNDAAQQPLFTYVASGGVHVEAFDVCPDGVAGKAHAWQSGNEPLEGWVRLCVPYVAMFPSSYAHGALVHELGHVLGLDHEDLVTSVMHSPSATEWTLEAGSVDTAIGNVAAWHVGTRGL